MTKFSLILPCLIFMFQPLNAKVESPNYDFSLEVLEDFFPEKNVKNLDTKYGNGEDQGTEQGLTTLKYKVSHLRYKFPVLVQVRNGIIEDFFARLPSYFLHDIFFQSLVNRYGKQDVYRKTQEEAYYVWNKGNLKHIYSAACTITCFPVFYAVEKKETNLDSILQKMKKAN